MRHPNIMSASSGSGMSVTQVRPCLGGSGLGPEPPPGPQARMRRAAAAESASSRQVTFRLLLIPLRLPDAGDRKHLEIQMVHPVRILAVFRERQKVHPEVFDRQLGLADF